MTIKEKLTEHLEDNGLFTRQAEAVMESAVADTENVPGMEHRWDDSGDEYPGALYAALVMYINRKALEWMDANAPQHWARGMFT